MAVDLEVGLVCPPAHLWVPEYAETDGDLAADLAASVSLNGGVRNPLERSRRHDPRQARAHTLRIREPVSGDRGMDGVITID